MNLGDLWRAGRYADAFILMRHSYRMGAAFANDKVYDKVEDFFKKQRLKGNQAFQDVYEYLDRVYDDDPVPCALLKEIGRLDLIPNMLISSKYADALNSDKSLSIIAVRSDWEVWVFIRDHKGLDLMISTKGDGANTKLGYIFGDLEVGLSRGRKGNCFDYTKACVRIAPIKIDTKDSELVTVRSESFVLPNSLKYMRSLYPDKFANEKSGGISMLRTEYPEELYEHLTTYAFGLEGVEGINTVQEQFDKLKSFGFNVVPHKLIPYDTIPKTFEEFQPWLKDLMSEMYELSKGLPSDGLVLEVNDLTASSTVSQQYADRNIALKFGFWGGNLHEGKIVDIVMEQQRVFASCRIKIQPMKTSDGCNAEWLNGYNPSILIQDNLNIGSKVYFERESGTINKLYRGGS